MDNNQSNNQPKNMVLTYLLVVFFALFVGTGIFLVFNNKNTAAKNNQQKQVVAPSEAPTQGLINLVLSDGTTSATVNKEVQVDVMADSNGNNISGYDLALVYDPTSFDFVRATSSFNDFKLYTYKKSNYLSILGTKIPQSQTPSVFSQTKIVSLFFKPVKAGNYSLSLKPLVDVDKTDLVTDQTEILNPQLNELEISVN